VIAEISGRGPLGDAASPCYSNRHVRKPDYQSHHENDRWCGAFTGACAV